MSSFSKPRRNLIAVFVLLLCAPLRCQQPASLDRLEQAMRFYREGKFEVAREQAAIALDERQIGGHHQLGPAEHFAHGVAGFFPEQPR